MMFNKTDFFFLIAAGVSFLASVSLWFFIDRDYGLFVGIWVPSVLSFWACIRLVILSRKLGNR